MRTQRSGYSVSTESDIGIVTGQKLSATPPPRATEGAPRVAILNNQIMPYRLPLFERLYARQTIDPVVLYSGRQAWDRSWSMDDFTLSYPHDVLRGFVVRLKKPRYGEWRTVWVNPSLLWHLKRIRPEAVVAYEYSVPAMTALLYSRLSGCRYLTWSEMTPRTSRSLSPGQRWARRVILSRGHAAIATSHAARDEFLQRGVDESKIVVAPQPLDVAWYREAARRRNGSRNGRVVLYVGGLNERKGVVHLVDAFRKVLRQLPDATLRLVGEGAMEPALRARCERLGISASVEFTGFVEPSLMPRIYAGADVCVLPSLEDTFGVVATESLASEVPLICSTHTGFASHATDGRNAFIVDPEDADQMADRLRQLLCDGFLRTRFRKNGQVLLREFDPDRVARSFEEAIGLALGGP